MSFRRLGVRERIGMLLFMMLIFIVGTTAYYYNRHSEEEEVTDADCSIYQKTTETDYVGNDSGTVTVIPKEKYNTSKRIKGRRSQNKRKIRKSKSAKEAGSGNAAYRRFEKDTVPRIRR